MAEKPPLDRAQARVAAMRRKYALRDHRNAEVSAVLAGDYNKVAPDLFSDEWPRPLVANRISVYTRHAAAALAPLPNFSCESGKMDSDRAREFAEKRGKIVQSYFDNSLVQLQMQERAGQFYTHGLMVTSVEPDFDAKAPLVVYEDPARVYPLWDRIGRTVAVATVFDRALIDLIVEFPDLEGDIKRAYGHGTAIPDLDVEVVKYVDAHRIAMWVENKPDLVFIDVANPLGKCNVVVTPLPGTDGTTGAFDDLIWVQLGLHAMQVYTMQGVAQAVNAPIAVPDDVHEVAIGPNEVVRSRTPRDIHRIGLDVPQGAWAAQEYLSRETEFGAIVPEALGGQIDASVVTGKGVQQLMAGYSQQIAMAQESLAAHHKAVASLALEVDEFYFPDVEKSISGKNKGVPYSVSYKPKRDIRGDYSVNVQYGGVAGMDPNRSLVYLLQELGADIVSKDYVRRHLPADIDPSDEEAQILLEQTRGSLMQAFSAFLQSLPEQQALGADPSDLIAKGVTVTKALQRGTSIEDALAEVFPPPEPVEQEAPVEVDPMTGEPVEGGPAAGGSGGLPGSAFRPGTLPTRGPGGRPDLNMLFAGTTASGQPNLQAGVSRMMPA